MPRAAQGGSGFPSGEPFPLSPYEAIALRRTREANVLLLGDVDDAEMPDLAVRAALHSFPMSARALGAAVSVVDFIGDEDGVKPGSTVRGLSPRPVGARYLRPPEVRLRSSRPLPPTLTAASRPRTTTRPPNCWSCSASSARQFWPRTSPTGGATSPPWRPTRRYWSGFCATDPEFGVHTVVSADTARSVQSPPRARHLG